MDRNIFIFAVYLLLVDVAVSIHLDEMENVKWIAYYDDQELPMVRCVYDRTDELYPGEYEFLYPIKGTGQNELSSIGYKRNLGSKEVEYNRPVKDSAGQLLLDPKYLPNEGNYPDKASVPAPANGHFHLEEYDPITDVLKIHFKPHKNYLGYAEERTYLFNRADSAIINEYFLQSAQTRRESLVHGETLKQDGSLNQYEGRWSATSTNDIPKVTYEGGRYKYEYSDTKGNGNITLSRVLIQDSKGKERSSTGFSRNHDNGHLEAIFPGERWRFSSSERQKIEAELDGHFEIPTTDLHKGNSINLIFATTRGNKRTLYSFDLQPQYGQYVLPTSKGEYLKPIFNGESTRHHHSSHDNAYQQGFHGHTSEYEYGNGSRRVSDDYGLSDSQITHYGDHTELTPLLSHHKRISYKKYGSTNPSFDSKH